MRIWQEDFGEFDWFEDGRPKTEKELQQKIEEIYSGISKCYVTIRI